MQRGSAALTLVLIIVLAGLMVSIFALSQSNFGSTQATSQALMENKAITPAVAAGDANSLRLYTDPDLNFQFQYPSNLSVSQDNEDAYFKRNGGSRNNFTNAVGYQPPQSIKAVLVGDPNNLDQAGFAIWVFNNPNSLDASGWFENYWYYPLNWGMYNIADKAKIVPSHQATVGGQQVYYGQVAYQDGSPSYYLIPQSGKMFVIKVTGDSATKILATLKL